MKLIIIIKNILLMKKWDSKWELEKKNSTHNKRKQNGETNPAVLITLIINVINYSIKIQGFFYICKWYSFVRNIYKTK